MHHRHRAALLCAAAATLVAPAVCAQQATPTPTPAPARTPTIVTPALDRFSLPSAGTQSQPRPTPTPSAAPTPAPTAAATPGVVVPPIRTTVTPRLAERPIARPPRTAAPTPTPAQAPAPQPSSAATPVALPAPAAAATPAPTEQPASGIPWLWILLGGAGLLAVGAIGWLLGRRTRAVHEPIVVPAAPRPAPPPPAPPPAPRPALAAVPAAPPEPIAIDFHPLSIEVSDKGAVIEFEMGLFNASGTAADGLRVSLLLASANPDQDALIANFHAASGLPEAGPPVDLPAGEGGRIPGKLMIEAERIHVVQVGGRPMFVPIVLIDLRWRGGLSIRRHGADFMIGTAGQGGKLGPIWLDRGAQRVGGLSASRYLPQARPVAA